MGGVTVVCVCVHLGIIGSFWPSGFVYSPGLSIQTVLVHRTCMFCKCVCTYLSVSVVGCLLHVAGGVVFFVVS